MRSWATRSCWGWFPTGGYVELRKGVRPWLPSLVVLALALGAAQFPLLARITRASVLVVRQMDHVQAVIAAGGRVSAYPNSTISS